MADIETVDVYCIDDFLAHMPSVTGRVALAHRLCRRLTTPRGRFRFWPNFGTDMRRYLLSKVPSSQIASDAAQECEKDEQVESVTVTVERVDFDQRELTLDLQVVDAAGPFEFTMTIGEARLTLIGLQALAS
ncbi:MAG TPA: hypothetical protein VK540_09965 [Polyangiaceae bacterium]|nr:hypothetical protein [Polyangiaceae bacterium]